MLFKSLPASRERGDCSILGIFLLPLLFLPGCQTATVRHPLTASLSSSDPHTQTEFWYQLANRPITSNDDAFHALLLYVDGADRFADYPRRAQELRARHMLPQNFNGSAAEAVNRGTLAVALVQMLKID